MGTWNICCTMIVIWGQIAWVKPDSDCVVSSVEAPKNNCITPEDEASSTQELIEKGWIQSDGSDDTNRASVNPIFADIRWPFNTAPKNPKLVDIPYDASEFDDYELYKLQEAIEGFRSLTCINFVPLDCTNCTYLKFKKDGQQCSAGYGKSEDVGPQVIRMDRDACFHNLVIQHEMMHSLGFFHEHQRFDREEHNVEISWDRVNDAYKSQFETIFDPTSAYMEDTCDLPYDGSSVMQYNPYSGQKDGEYSDTILHVNYSRSPELSLLDIVRINCLYKCTTTVQLEQKPTVYDMPLMLVNHMKEMGQNSLTAMNGWFTLTGTDSISQLLQFCQSAEEPIKYGNYKYLWAIQVSPENFEYTESCSQACQRYQLKCNFDGFTNLADWDRQRLMSVKALCSSWLSDYGDEHSLYMEYFLPHSYNNEACRNWKVRPSHELESKLDCDNGRGRMKNHIVPFCQCVDNND